MKKNWFTLIELLVVIAIVAILVSLGYNAFKRARQNALHNQVVVRVDAEPATTK